MALRLGFLSLLLVFAFPAAAAPAGHYSYDFEAADSPVWDVSGVYYLSPTVAGDIGVDFMVEVAQDGRGNLSGAGTTEVRIDGELVSNPGNYTVKGKVFRAGAVTKVTATIKLSGSGVFQGQTRSYSLSANYALTVDSAGKVKGTGRGSARASGIGEGPLRDDVNAPVPGTSGGAWKLELSQIQTSGKNVTGTAMVTLDSGRPIPLVVKGTYVSKTGKTTLNLSGTGAQANNRLTLNTTGDNLQIVKATGMLLGQVVSLK